MHVKMTINSWQATRYLYVSKYYIVFSRLSRKTLNRVKRGDYIGNSNFKKDNERDIYIYNSNYNEIIYTCILYFCNMTNNILQSENIIISTFCKINYLFIARKHRYAQFNNFFYFPSRYNYNSTLTKT